MSAAGVPIIGIVGGIGSGKSTLANALQNEFRSYRLDADAAGHRALREENVRERLIESFGSEILDPAGEISRPALARLVFGDSAEQKAAKAKLEQIVHPAIERDLSTEISKYQSAEDCDLILLDAALMLEAGWSEMCDAIIFLDVPREIRLERVSRRGWDDAELTRREASQLGLDEKRSRSDLILDQSGDLAKSARTLAEWLRKRFPQLPRLTPKTASGV